MNIRQLKEQLAGVLDDTEIVLSGGDHSYRWAALELTTAILAGDKRGDHYLTEDHGEKLQRREHRIPVLLLTPC